MKTRQLAGRFALTSLLTFLVPIVLFAPQAYAETYVAGQFGATFPQSLSDGKVTQDGFAGLDLSDQPLKDSLSLGGKLGHYFTRARWIGVETGVSYTTPHIKEGSLTFTGPGGSASCGRVVRRSPAHDYLGCGHSDDSLPRLSSPTVCRHRSLPLLRNTKRTNSSSRTVGHGYWPKW